MRNLKFSKYPDIHAMKKDVDEYIKNSELGIMSTMPDDYFDNIEFRTEGTNKLKYGYKNGFPYYISSETDIEAMQKAKLQGRYQSMYPKTGATIGDIAAATPEVVANVPKGAAIGIDNVFKLIDSVTGGAVTEVDNFLSENFPNTLGKKIEYKIPEGAAETTGKIIGQYVIPGAGVYKMARGAILLAEPLTVGLFSSKDEGNLANTIEDMFPNFTKSSELSKTIIEGLSVDGDDTEVMARAKNIVADAAPFVVVEKFYKILKGLKQNPEALEELKSVGAAATPKEPPTPVEVVDSQGNPVNPTRDITPSEKPFYSNVEKAISNMTMTSGQGDQILATIKNTSGVKQSEIEDLGLDQFLAGKEKVTMEELNDFIADKSLTTRVTDTMLDETKSERQVDFYVSEDAPNALKNATSMEDAKLIVMNDEGLYNDFLEYQASKGEVYDDFSDADVEDFLGEKYGLVDVKEVVENNTQYGDYTLEGGENYKEMLITIPSDGKPFIPQHFSGKVPDGENLIAHARFNERTIDGKKTLFVEEIQSDLHQVGRKRGYKIKTPEIEELEKLKDEVFKKYQNSINQYTDLIAEKGIYKNGMLSDEAKLLESQRKNYSNQIDEYDKKINELSGVVPDAPFKKNWHELTMKRLIKYAIDNDFDAISFTPGKIQNERYDLSKKIENVNIAPSEKAPNKIYIQAYSKGNLDQVLGHHILPEQLDEYVGKDLADKIRSDIDKDKSFQSLDYRGVDLEVGGEGMIGFYDKILPAYLSKFGKKYDAKLEQKDIYGDGKKMMHPSLSYVYQQNVEPNIMYQAVGKNDEIFAVYEIKKVDDSYQIIQTKNGKKDMIYESSQLQKTQSVLVDELEGFYVPQLMKTKEQKVPFMLFTPEMKKEILQEGVPIAQLEDREQEQQTAVV